MPMIVANNLNALSTQRNLNLNNTALSKSLEKLSSGYKINTGADDPSGLVISEQLRAQNAGLQRAVQNTQEANNVLGIAEGSLNEMNNILKKMRQLAIHSANSGVTSPEQVAADQAEVDSSVQTLDRIARTSKYSDQFLLNGNKQLNYSSMIEVNDTNDHKLLDEGLSDIRQIFKRDGFTLNINFSGVTTSGADQVDNGNEAQKAYLEISKGKAAATQVNTGYTGDDKSKNYTLSQDQAFTVSGNMGSRTMSFAKGTHLGEMVSSINSVTDSTGVKATLIFDSDTTVANSSNGSDNTDTGLVANGVTTVSASNTHSSGMADVYNRNELGEITTNGVTAISVSSSSGLELGKNLDGYGRLYLKMIDSDTYEIYKDEAMTMQVAGGDITGSGTNASTTVIAVNNSGIENLGLTFSSAGHAAGSTAVLQLGVLHEDTTTSGSTQFTDGIDLTNLYNDSKMGTGGNAFTISGSFFSGVKLGVNTSDTGKLFIKGDVKSSGTSHIYVYKDSRMRDEDLVAESDDVTGSTNGGAIRVYGVQSGANGPTSGLYGTLNFDDVTSNVSFNGSIVEFTNLAVRISAAEYGSDQFVSVDASQGAVWSHYTEQDDAQLLDAGLTGVSWTEYGRDASVSINGQEVKLDGTRGEVANLDTAATLVFNSGSLGCTTIAAVGYDEGAWGSRASMINDDKNNYITHALKSTTESLSDWTGGMQFQLGEGAGDQERTIFSLKNMTATELGVTKFSDNWNGSAIKTDKYLSVNDLLSGGLASLGSDPVKALSIIDKAIADVSNVRAQIGAFQSNMLTTNTNSLSVAIENITKTESYIRDADMASETTSFSKNQIMVQAGTSMLAQANSQQQSVLTLLG